jgi:hypothetical protein
VIKSSRECVAHTCTLSSGERRRKNLKLAPLSLKRLDELPVGELERGAGMRVVYARS